jgi:hypothetical protein
VARPKTACLQPCAVSAVLHPEWVIARRCNLTVFMSDLIEMTGAAHVNAASGPLHRHVAFSIIRKHALARPYIFDVLAPPVGEQNLRSRWEAGKGCALTWVSQ